MLYIDEGKIGEVLAEGFKATEGHIEEILAGAGSLRRLSLQEAAALLSIEEPRMLKRLFEAASLVKDRIYGKRVVLFAPLYISNECSNSCVYCAFRSENRLLKRRSLSRDEVREEAKCLLEQGHKRALVVAGESAPQGKKAVDYYVESVEAVYSASVGKNRIRRANINCAPLSIEDFKRLKASGIGTYQLFQETYHDRTYRTVHPKGPKSDPDNRMDAIDRAFLAGIDDVGIGALYGLCDYIFETLALLMHVEHLERRFGVGPHTISVPRIETASGAEFTRRVPHRLSDEEFKKVVAVLRLSVPYTGIILSTRESPELRDELFGLGVSQVSAASRTSPGGYSQPDACDDAQFSLNDHRSLDEVIGSIISKGMMPSFCAACYRRERTGQAFMKLARPGAIKDMCAFNALITLKEYLDDFASDKVRTAGYALIEKEAGRIDAVGRQALGRFFDAIDNGVRDAYV
ncbi:MAG: [FeFe] hydrogenase H-cluster radical SAM maturase HydG [Candidatus Omnitrophica bacterium]|nr:[FeFe] hydrogenase H-cluster radical SAM maturase HydG [Candidatus Omnitrophota bacterium]